MAFVTRVGIVLAALVAATAVRSPAHNPATVPGDGASAAGALARDVKVTVLSTMLAGDPGAGIGEWGFAALVEVDGRRFLFDTGARPDVVLANARELGIDLSDVTDVILSHNHADHVGGLVTLRRELRTANPAALSRAHVARGIFWSRRGPNGREDNGLLPLRTEFERLGGTFVEHGGPTSLAPGVWFTGPVDRVHPERNWSVTGTVTTPDRGEVEDNVPEDASLVIDTAEGLVLVAGCGHAGVINTVEFARRAIRQAPIHAAIGGFHLFRATDEQLAWTAAHLRAAGLQHLLGAHCTGIEAVYRLRELAGLDRRRAVVSAVGSSFTLGAGIEPRALAR